MGLSFPFFLLFLVYFTFYLFSTKDLFIFEMKLTFLLFFLLYKKQLKEIKLKFHFLDFLSSFLYAKKNKIKKSHKTSKKLTFFLTFTPDIKVGCFKTISVRFLGAFSFNVRVTILN